MVGMGDDAVLGGLFRFGEFAWKGMNATIHRTSTPPLNNVKYMCCE